MRVATTPGTQAAPAGADSGDHTQALLDAGPHDAILLLDALKEHAAAHGMTGLEVVGPPIPQWAGIPRRHTSSSEWVMHPGGADSPVFAGLVPESITRRLGSGTGEADVPEPPIIERGAVRQLRRRGRSGRFRCRPPGHRSLCPMRFGALLPAAVEVAGEASGAGGV